MCASGAEAMQKAAERKPRGHGRGAEAEERRRWRPSARSLSRCGPVNYNCPGQLVVAGGEKGQIEAFCKKVAEAGGRAVPLAVSGGFHSPFMESAGEELRTVLAGHGAPGAPGAGVRQPERQALHPGGGQGAFGPAGEEPGAVAGDHRGPGRPGGGHLFECGPGKTLCGLIRKTVKGAKVFQVEDGETLSAAVEAVKAAE